MPFAAETSQNLLTSLQIFFWNDTNVIIFSQVAMFEFWLSLEYFQQEPKWQRGKEERREAVPRGAVETGKSKTVVLS